MSRHRLVVSLLVPLAFVGTVLFASPRTRPGDDLTRAARAFLSSLDEGQRANAVIEFDDANRFNWNYVPRQRLGIALADLDVGQLGAAKKLVATALSDEGARKVDGVLKLEGILRDLESVDGEPALGRDPLQYHVTVFGEPGDKAPWGFRFEGHHVSINVAAVSDDLVAVTPFFLGAHPGEVRKGPNTGMRLLSKEEEIARDLLLSLDEEQRATAQPDERVPDDIFLGPDRRQAGPLSPAGLSGADMDESQRSKLRAIVELYVDNLRGDLAQDALARIDRKEIETWSFVWLGEDAPGKPHYWRVQSDDFAIELDNSQDGANHVHTVWRDFKNDFGVDYLREHHARDHARR